MDLPEKLYFTIGEVSDLTGVKPHVLRYWEGEFPTLRPRKDRSGSRRYRRADIEEVVAIRQLLYDEGYKIAGAKKLLRQRHQKDEETAQQIAIPFSALDPQEQLAVVRRELEEIRALLTDEFRAGEAEG